MFFKETKLKGAYIIELDRLEDKRGFNARAWCQKEFEAQGLVSQLVQTNIIFNKKMGMLRGMHYQVEPAEETKLFRCTRGAIYDVIIDMRSNSPTYKQWLGLELTEENYRMLYVPQNFAQGFLTLENNTEITYQVSQFYSPQFERGIRYNDPAFQIKWPIDVRMLSNKDKSWPNCML